MKNIMGILRRAGIVLGIIAAVSVLIVGLPMSWRGFRSDTLKYKGNVTITQQEIEASKAKERPPERSNEESRFTYTPIYEVKGIVNPDHAGVYPLYERVIQFPFDPVDLMLIITIAGIAFVILWIVPAWIYTAIIGIIHWISSGK